MQTGIAAVEPEEGWEVEAGDIAHPFQGLAHGEDAVAADECLRLHPEGEECDQVDKGEGAQEQPASQTIGEGGGVGADQSVGQ